MRVLNQELPTQLTERSGAEAGYSRDQNLVVDESVFSCLDSSIGFLS